MFVIALASLVLGYALLYYAIDAMTHYDSSTKTTTGIPFGVVLGLPSTGNDTAMVFAHWGASGSSAPATGAAAASPAAPSSTNVMPA